MPINWLIIFFSFMVLISSGCNNKAGSKEGNSINDSVQAAKEEEDSLRLLYANCYENFFTVLPKFKDSGSALLLLQGGKKITLTRFFKEEFMSEISQYGKKDMDGDGVEELIVFNNTGGAHCCDEYYIFGQRNNNEYEFKAHLMGGETCINASDNTFTYSFGETFGYFFTCYACEFKDSSGAFNSIREIKIKYTKGKFEVIRYDSASEKQILINLDILQKHGFEKVEELMDTGWRKEFAMNLAVWHFNHNKDWRQTRALFDKYYDFEDAEKVWKEFYATMFDFVKQNTF